MQVNISKLDFCALVFGILLFWTGVQPWRDISCLSCSLSWSFSFWISWARASLCSVKIRICSKDLRTLQTNRGETTSISLVATDLHFYVIFWSPTAVDKLTSAISAKCFDRCASRSEDTLLRWLLVDWKERHSRCSWVSLGELGGSPSSLSHVEICSSSSWRLDWWDDKR